MIAQILAGAIFVAMFGFIITEKFERHLVTLACGVLTLIFVFGVCMRDVHAIEEALLHGVNWETIFFIAGMMIMVEGMARVGFFRWLCIAIAKAVNFKAVPVFIVFMCLSAVLSMFIDSITVILFLAEVTIELAQTLRFNPVPVIIAEIFCANLGGSATMCGDPPNIIIGTALDYSFSDFLFNTGLIAGIGMIFTVAFFYLIFRKELGGSKRGYKELSLKPSELIEDKKGFAINTVIFFIAVLLLLTHSYTGLTVAFIGLFIATLTLIAAGKHADEVIHGVDFKTLLFFVGLFIVISGLEQTGMLQVVADFIATISGGNPLVMVVIIIWISAIASAFVDNIPFAATMIPVIKSLSLSGALGIDVMAWSLAVGTDIGGSATPIGGSANVVGIAAAAKKGYKITWGRYCKYMVPASIMVLSIATAIIWLRYL